MRAFVASFGVVLVFVLLVHAISTFGTIFALHPWDVAVLPRAARRALGAAFRVRGLPSVAQGAIRGLRGLADLADRARVACLETCLVGKLSGQTREACRSAFGVLVFSFHTVRTFRSVRVLAHFADVAPVACWEARLVAKLAGQARQARCLAFRFLIVSRRTFVADLGIVLIRVLVVDTIPTCGTVVAFPKYTAERPGAAV